MRQGRAFAKIGVSVRPEDFMPQSRRVQLLTATIMSGASITASAQTVAWQAVETAMGRPGVSQPGGIHRFNFPRGDMRVTVDGVDIRPALALGGWIAFK